MNSWIDFKNRVWNWIWEWGTCPIDFQIVIHSNFLRISVTIGIACFSFLHYFKLVWKVFVFFFPTLLWSLFSAVEWLQCGTWYFYCKLWLGNRFYRFGFWISSLRSASILKFNSESWYTSNAILKNFMIPSIMRIGCPGTFFLALVFTSKE